MIDVGSGDAEGFINVSKEFLKLFVELGGLKRDADVLEVGCGVGRMARALAGYLNPDARYEGFEIMDEYVEWCSREITSRHPNFRFQWADVYNGRYNPKGHAGPEEYKFPYRNKSFDFVILTSVFTHLLPQGVDNYLSEIRRVLRRRGTCFATWFLLNDVSVAAVAAGTTMIPFPFERRQYRLASTEVEELAVAFDESWVRERYAAAHFDVLAMHPGSWAPRPDAVSSQDIVIARRGR